jgi:catechol 2,3-dioxygenase-like lactoylglutathione lyase family enzyme
MKLTLCLLCFFTVSFCLTFSSSAWAQLTPFNDQGVTIGHIHILTPDPEAHKKLWVDLFGAQVTKAGGLEIIKLPGTIILIMKAQPSEATGQPTIDHFAFWVRDLADAKKKLASAQISIDSKSIATFPDGVRVEFIEDKALKVPIALHHFHIFSGDKESLRNWYANNFGIKFPAAADFPGGEVLFTEQKDPQRVASKGHALDHIGFEVKNLEEFCKRLEANGIKPDMGIIAAPQIGLKVTFVTDPAGTRIELTEGLLGK